jgi:hypothetical protein
MIRALFRWFRRPSALDFNALEPIQPRVTPDPAAVEALERRRAELSYRPQTAFHRDTLVSKST